MKEIIRFSGAHEFLSNFHTGHPFMLHGSDDWWNSGEHAYQASKATTTADYFNIRNAPTPAAAKRLGRRIALSPNWRAHRKSVMLRVLLAKYAIGEMREQLSATGDAVLVEGNTWGDVFWGAVPEGERGFSSALPWYHLESGKVLAGENWLGRLIMMVRDVQS